MEAEEEPSKLKHLLASPWGMLIGIILLVYGMATRKYFLLSLGGLALVFTLISAFFLMLKKQQLKKLDDPDFALEVEKIVGKILKKYDYSTIADDEIKRELKKIGIKNVEVQNKILVDARIANISEIPIEKIL